jgi:hypothetical protein
MHLLVQHLGVIERPRAALEGGPSVDALLFTLLTPAASKIALNVETGDYARVEDRDCSCLLGELGLRTHLSDLRSFEKMTGEGVTFARSNLEQILEDVLPARFGGTSIDYQLAEEEAPDSSTRLILRVSPSVGPVDSRELQATLLAELARGGPLAAYHAGLWRNAGTVEVRREAPIVTRQGKVLPLQARRRQDRGLDPRRARPTSPGE